MKESWWPSCGLLHSKLLWVNPRVQDPRRHCTSSMHTFNVLDAKNAKKQAFLRATISNGVA